MVTVLRELAWFVEDQRVAFAGPFVGLTDDRSARNEECQVMEAGLAARVGSRFLCLVEEQLRASRAIRPIVEWVTRRPLEPLTESKDGHELVVVLLGRLQIRNADPDVVDERRFGQSGTSSPWTGRS